jgi:hypothetical protein
MLTKYAQLNVLVDNEFTFSCAYLVSITKHLVSLEIFQTFWLGQKKFCLLYKSLKYVVSTLKNSNY